MRFQIRIPFQLHIIDYNELNIKTAVKHFAENGYDYLYIIKNKKLYDVLNYHDFVRFGLEIRKRTYITDVLTVQTDTSKIEQFFLDNPEINRLAVTDSGKILYEINTMVEPLLLHSIEKNLFPLRFADMFYEQLKDVFSDYKKILLLAPACTADFIIKYFNGSAFTVISNTDCLFGLNFKEYDAVLDFLCGPKLIKIINSDIDTFNLYNFVEKILLEKLVNYAEDNNILLKLYRIPGFSELHCLNMMEDNVYAKKINFPDLMKDKAYLKEFCLDNESFSFIERRIISDTIRQDNNIWFTQEDCTEKGLMIRSGIRKTIPSNECFDYCVHFFGPCTVLGMLVRDEYTIPSIFARNFFLTYPDFLVINHGGLHGNNLLNSVIGALATPLKSGDIIVILDFFCNELKNDNTVIDTSLWFENDKSENEICFFDSLDHCNEKGNSIFACNIYADIAENIDFSKEKYKKRQRFFEKHTPDHPFNNYFTVSNAAGIRLYSKIKKCTSNSVCSNNGVFVCYDIESDEEFCSVLNRALGNCSRLFVFTSFDHLCIKKQLFCSKICMKYYAHKHINIIQLDHFFNIYRKIYEEPDEYKEFVNMIEYCFELSVYSVLPCIRFYTENNSDIRSKLNNSEVTVINKRHIFTVVAQSDNALQIIYPLDNGGYKIGWISKEAVE